MSGNSKDNARAEDFKRATAGVLRAIAEQPDVQVAFQPGPSGLSGKRARLPLPTRALPPAEMAKLRGQSDAIALRLRHHDDGLSTRSACRPAARPRTPTTLWNRCASRSIGSRFMNGVHANLRAKLSEECEAEGYDRMTRKDQLPIDKALALLDPRTPVRPGGAGCRDSRSEPVARHAWRHRRPGAVRDDRRPRTTRPHSPAPRANCWPRWIWRKPRLMQNRTTTPRTVTKAASSPARRTIRRGGRGSVGV